MIFYIMSSSRRCQLSHSRFILPEFIAIDWFILSKVNYGLVYWYFKVIMISLCGNIIAQHNILVGIRI